MFHTSKSFVIFFFAGARFVNIKNENYDSSKHLLNFFSMAPLARFFFFLVGGRQFLAVQFIIFFLEIAHPSLKKVMVLFAEIER